MVNRFVFASIDRNELKMSRRAWKFASTRVVTVEARSGSWKKVAFLRHPRRWRRSRRVLLRASADELDARLEALLEDARARDLDPATSRSIEALAGRVERVRGRAERVQTLADLWTQLTDTRTNP